MQGLEMPPVARLVLGKQFSDAFRRHRAVLKTPLGKNRHLQPEHRADSARHDLALEGIELFVRSLREIGERDRFGDGYYRRPGVRAKAVEAILARAGVAAHAAAAVAARIGEGVLD